MIDEELVLMPKLILTMHVACDGFEDMVWSDIQVCNDITMQGLAQLILTSVDIEDLTYYTIYSVGARYTEGKLTGNSVYDSREFTMADLYMDKDESFLLEGPGFDFDVKITAAMDAGDMDTSEYPKILAKSKGTLAEAQHLIDLAFPE